MRGEGVAAAQTLDGGLERVRHDRAASSLAVIQCITIEEGKKNTVHAKRQSECEYDAYSCSPRRGSHMNGSATVWYDPRLSPVANRVLPRAWAR